MCIRDRNLGWADAMAKILNTEKPKRKKTVVLSKTNRSSNSVVKAKEKYGFEIDGEMAVESEDNKSGQELKQSLIGSHEMKLCIRVCIHAHTYTVSYTHLDVYKRQAMESANLSMQCIIIFVLCGANN